MSIFSYRSEICRAGGLLLIIGIILKLLQPIISYIIWYDDNISCKIEYLIIFLPTVVLIAGLILMCSYKQKTYRIFLILIISSIAFLSILPYVQKVVVHEAVPYPLATSINGEVLSVINPSCHTYLTIFSFIWLGLLVLQYISTLIAVINIAPKIQTRKRSFRCFSAVLALSIFTMISARIFSVAYILIQPLDSQLRALTINGLRLGHDIAISDLWLFDPPFDFILMRINHISLSIFCVSIIVLIVIFRYSLSQKAFDS